MTLRWLRGEATPFEAAVEFAVTRRSECDPYGSAKNALNFDDEKYR